MAKGFSSQLRGYQNAPEGMRKDPTYPIFDLGYMMGKQEVAQVILGHLQQKYVHADDSPERGSEKATYLLGLAQELSELIKGIQPGDTLDN